MKFVDEWRAVMLRAWSVRVAAFWGAISGLLLVWVGLQEVMPVWLFAAGGVVMSMSIAVARLLKQPGTDE